MFWVLGLRVRRDALGAKRLSETLVNEGENQD